MTDSILGKKIDQTRVFTPDGVQIPVTRISIVQKDDKEIKIEEFLAVGDKLKISGISKGKGFAGVVKRWRFKGGPRTHGQSDRERAPGSIGQTTTPGRIYKGKHMAGRMGGDKTTIKGLKIIEIKPEEKLLIVTGLVPGSRGSKLLISKQ